MKHFRLMSILLVLCLFVVAPSFGAELSWYGQLKYNSTTKNLSTTNPLAQPGIYTADYSEGDQGAVGGGRTIKDLIDSIGITNKAKIILAHNSGAEWTDYVFSTSADYSANANIIFELEQGARVSIAIAQTLTIYSPANIIAQPNQHIFNGSGTVLFSVGGEDWPGWWGAVGNNIHDDTTAIQSAIDALQGGSGAGHGGKVNILAGRYKTTAKLNVPMLTHIQGAGAEVTTIYPNSCIGFDYLYSSGTGPINLSNLGINGGGNTDPVTGIGVRVANDANVAHKVYGLRIRNIRIESISTAVSLRSAWDAEISGCAFYFVDKGILVKGQCVAIRIHDNNMLSITSTGVGTNYGIWVGSTFDYDPGGVTEHKPEDVQVWNNWVVAFDYGMYVSSVLLVHVHNNDFDQEYIEGVHFITVNGVSSIENNWINLNNAHGIYGIYFAPVAVDMETVINVKGNNILNSVVVANSVGIYVGTKRAVKIEGNSLEGWALNDIKVSGGQNVNIKGNRCKSAISHSLFFQNTLAGVIHVEDNYLTGDIYVSLTNSSQFIIGANSGTYSTLIRGFSVIAAGTTTVNSYFAALPGPPPDFQTFANSQLTIIVASHSAPNGIGTISFGVNNVLVTAICTIAPGANTTIYWEAQVRAY